MFSLKQLNVLGTDKCLRKFATVRIDTQELNKCGLSWYTIIPKKIVFINIDIFLWYMNFRYFIRTGINQFCTTDRMMVDEIK